MITLPITISKHIAKQEQTQQQFAQTWQTQSHILLNFKD